MEGYHVPVLLKESVDLTVTDPEGFYVDGTMGGGGHSREILGRLSAGGRLLAIDQDDEALGRAGEWGPAYGGKLEVVKANFSEIPALLTERGVSGATGILLDLGVSSRQLDEGSRGFSFMRQGPLDMRMDRSKGKTAADLVMELKEEELIAIFREYGEEPKARRVAKAIAFERQKGPIATTADLAAIVEKALGRSGKKHPATKVFQALRIAVNGELDALKTFLAALPEILRPEGRVAVIAYHSLEDRLVKTRFRELTPHCLCPRIKPICDCGWPGSMELVEKRSVRPGDEEVEDNSRARSASLRVARRLPQGAGK